MGGSLRLIASYPRQPATLANIVNNAFRSDELPGIRHEWELVSFLRDRGFRETAYASALPAFHRLTIDDDDVYGAILRLLRHIYSMETFRDALTDPGGAQFNLLIEPDRRLRIASGPSVGLGSNFDLSKGEHAAYMQALEITDVNGNRVTGGIEGKDVTVVVVDSGAEASALANSSADFRDIINQSTKSAIDNRGHGTAMVKIIRSVAPQARVCAVRVFDMSDGPELSDAYAGIVGALSEFSPGVVSLSLGFPDLASPCTVCGSHATSRSTVLRHLFDTVEKLAKAGGNPDPIFVAATGNDHPNIGMYCPAAYANGSILAVGSINKSKQRSQFSNFGKSAGGRFAVAPGGDWDYQTNKAECVGEGQDSQGNSTCCMGTSPAAAYAAGLTALYREQTTGSASDVVDKAIAKCKTDISPSYLPNEHGSGRLVFVNTAQDSNGDDANIGIEADEDRVVITSASGTLQIPRKWY